MKVLIGTSSIREGMNLQRYSLVLYDLFIAWNPTDRQQLIGRIFRQGNQFYNVFIVSPTMADSMDIFMLQKLEEKTARIGTLWDRGTKDNALSTEEYNPEEIKYHLVSDPYALAKMEADEELMKLGEEQAMIESNMKIAEAIVSEYKTVQKYEQELKDLINYWRPANEPSRIFDNEPKEAWHFTKEDYIKRMTKGALKRAENHYLKIKNSKGENSKEFKKAAQSWNEASAKTNAVISSHHKQVENAVLESFFEKAITNSELSFRKAK